MNLVHEATLKSYSRRKALWRFLRNAGIADSFLATWREDEFKRDFLDRLFAKLPGQSAGQEILLSLARDLAQQEAFPDLEGWEDSQRKLEEARAAVRALRSALSKIDDQVTDERERRRAQERFRKHQKEVRRSKQMLDSLAQRLDELGATVGSQKAGYAFQDWFYDLMDFFEVANGRPYVTGGRQIDGSITHAGTTYLVELTFTAEATGAPDVDTMLKKIEDKADNTMGITVSISGFTETAVAGASGRRTPVLLMEHRHLYLALRGVMAFGEIVDRIRHHASQTGEALLAPEGFGG